MEMSQKDLSAAVVLVQCLQFQSQVEKTSVWWIWETPARYCCSPAAVALMFAETQIHRSYLTIEQWPKV